MQQPAMTPQTIRCPGCGAPLPVPNHLTRLLVCNYCQQTIAIQGQQLTVQGQGIALVDYPSRLKVGVHGRVLGKRFLVLGRVRYENDDGYWDEWLITYDDTTAGWLAEDEGEYIVYHKEPFRGSPPSFEGIRVATTVKLSDLPVYISEKQRGTVAGVEGQIDFLAQTGAPIQYINGNTNGRAVSLILRPGEISFALGTPLEFHQLEVI